MKLHRLSPILQECMKQGLCPYGEDCLAWGCARKHPAWDEEDIEAFLETRIGPQVYTIEQLEFLYSLESKT